MKFQKVTALGLAAIMMSAALAGCGQKTESPSNVSDKKVEGKINLTIGGWPNETNPASVERYNDYAKQYGEKYPNVNIIPDEASYADAKIFQPKAAAGQLPTLYTTHFTEIQKTIRSNYAYNITEVLKERGYLDALNPDLLGIATGADGQIYAIPTNAYMMGLIINRELFEEAGLVNADGTAKIPQTYEEMAITAQTIKQKTGKAGFAICTTNNCGGWHFMNIAWSYGVNFMKQREDGTWEATFNTPEAVAALQYVKDLKWKYDALPDNSVIDQNEGHKLIGIGEAAMQFDAQGDSYSRQFGLNPEKLSIGALPAGPAGRYAQTGGSVVVFSHTATIEEINAGFDWLELIGTLTIEYDEQRKENTKKSYETTIAENGIVFPGRSIPLWVNPERAKAEQEIIDEYTNVDIKHYQEYYDATKKGVVLRPEEPMACQQLYSVLDNAIQEVITNKDADCAKLIATACEDFQINHLDKL